MRAYGTHHQPAGTWSDDASLTFCLAEAIAEGYAVRTLANNCLRWYEHGFWTPHGRVFDIGITTREALGQLKKSSPGACPLVGGRDEMSNGNGALMRILPLAFYRPEDALLARYTRLVEASAVTHGHVRSAIACFLYLELTGYLRAGLSPAQAYAKMCEQAPTQFTELGILAKEVNHFERLLSGQLVALPESTIQSSGYVVHTLEAALWYLLRYETYAATVLAAVNLGDDTDTTGAVVGGLAGLYYGEENIPAVWVKALARRADIEDLCRRASQSIVGAGAAPAPTAPARPVPNSY